MPPSYGPAPQIPLHAKSGFGIPSGVAFPETRWSVLAAATLHGDDRARLALDEMCRCYWQSVFAVIRSRGCGEDIARDQTQGFFAYLIEKSALRRADRARGRFRTYLLTLLWRYLRDERERATAEKRGGPMAGTGSDDELETLPAEALPLAETLDREWALATLERALEVVRSEVLAARGEAAWAVLRGFLPGSASVPVIAVAAGIRAVFQVQVPVPPLLQADGSFVAGHLHIVPLQGATATVVAMPAPEFSQGYRIDFVSTAGPSFVVELRAATKS